jgi:hypothetical protein
MKARFAILLVIMAALASQNALAQTVKYSVVVTSTFAYCYNAAFTASPSGPEVRFEKLISLAI